MKFRDGSEIIEPSLFSKQSYVLAFLPILAQYQRTSCSHRKPLHNYLYSIEHLT